MASRIANEHPVSSDTRGTKSVVKTLAHTHITRYPTELRKRGNNHQLMHESHTLLPNQETGLGGGGILLPSIGFEI